MNRFKNIESRFFPTYAWEWNDIVTKEGIKERIDEMYDMGIRGVYVIAAPKNWRPYRRKTYLEPEYLSDEYLELLKYTHEYAIEKGMFTWHYNEAPFPSGAADGKIVERNPALYKKSLRIKKKELKKGEIYLKEENTVTAFVGDEKINDGYVAKDDITISEYVIRPTYLDNIWASPLDADIADPRTTDLFIELTHEAIKKKFGIQLMQKSVYMFDDEPHMDSWSYKFEESFFKKYGYDILDYVPVIFAEKRATTKIEKQASVDYNALCGDLIFENYFMKQKKWLNENGMLSMGHLGGESETATFVRCHLGANLKQLRAYDVPGIDVIWNQIDYPDENGRSCFEGNEFFPRLASSVARQAGGNVSFSESLAVCSDIINYELMRYIVGYQAIRGINLYNFMYISYSKENLLPFQYRPNFIKEHIGRNLTYGINDYTARLSYILQKGKARIHTALYYPSKTITLNAYDEGKEAIKSFENLGDMLEANGVDFDLIDDVFVEAATLDGTALVNQNVRYDYVFVPSSIEYEPECVKEKLSKTVSGVVPHIKTNKAIKTHIVDNEKESYVLFFNQSGEFAEESVKISDNRKIYEINLLTGDIAVPNCSYDNGEYEVNISLLRGDCYMLMFTDEIIDAKKSAKYEKIGEIKTPFGKVTREYIVDDYKGLTNIYYENNGREMGNLWDKDFSGEVTYEILMPTDADEDMVLDLGNVECQAEVFFDNKKIAELTMPPYRFSLPKMKKGDMLRIAVANTGARACAKTKYFDNSPIVEVGDFNERMNPKEQNAPYGSIGDIITIYKKSEF